MHEVNGYQRIRKDYVNADWYSDLNDAIADSDGRPIVCATSRTQTTQVTIPTALQTGFRLVGLGEKAPITYSGDGAFFKADPSTTPQTSTRREHWSVEDLYLLGPGAATAGSIGLHVNNALRGSLRNVVVRNFETGVKFDGLDLSNGAACYYNTAHGLWVRGCDDGIVFTGRANANSVFGGHAHTNERGVVIGSTTNNITISGVDIESNTVYGADIAGAGNHFLGCRFENPLATKEIRFDDGAGGTDGRKNTIISFHSSVDVYGQIDWDANEDNTVIWPGFFHLGNSDASIATRVFRATRSVASDGEPFIDIADNFSGSGSPIGLRYRSRRLGDALAYQISSDGTNWFTTHSLQTNHANGKAELWLGAFNSSALDTNLYRDAANVLKTDDKLVIGSTVGVLKLEPIALPATCAVGELCVDTADKKLKLCTAANTWTVVGSQA